MLVSLIISFDIILKFLLNKLISSVYFVKKINFLRKKFIDYMNVMKIISFVKI